MGKGERSLNPVDTFRKELKRKEIKKAKLTKELQKKQDDEERDKYDAFLAEFNRLTEEASKRSLTAIEKSKRKELKQYLASNSRFSQDEAASKRRKLGHDLPSGLYDPLSEEHQLMYERAQHHQLTIPPPIVPSPSSTVSKPPPPLPPPQVPDLDDTLPPDFFPDLPQEPLPRTHRPKQGPPIITVMAGYPPPPTGPIPSYPPQMISPMKSLHPQPTSTTTLSAKPVITTISALPQLRDLHKETLSFVPSTLHQPSSQTPHPAIPKKKKKVVMVLPSTSSDPTQLLSKNSLPTDIKAPGVQPQEKDMYDQFLQEMEGLL